MPSSGCSLIGAIELLALSCWSLVLQRSCPLYGFLAPEECVSVCTERKTMDMYGLILPVPVGIGPLRLENKQSKETNVLPSPNSSLFERASRCLVYNCSERLVLFSTYLLWYNAMNNFPPTLSLPSPFSDQNIPVYLMYTFGQHCFPLVDVSPSVQQMY